MVTHKKGIINIMSIPVKLTNLTMFNKDFRITSNSVTSKEPQICVCC